MELVDIYDDNKKLTGKTIKRGGLVQTGEHCLVVHLCIFNDRGEMLVQRRSLNKSKYPGAWDVSAGGFVKSGENGVEAVIRETKEELGIEIADRDIAYIMMEPFSYIFDEFYIYKGNIQLNSLKIQTEELSDVAYMSEKDIIDKISSGNFVDYSPDVIIKIFESGKL